MRLGFPKLLANSLKSLNSRTSPGSANFRAKLLIFKASSVMFATSPAGGSTSVFRLSLDRLSRQSFLVCRSRIALNLGQCLVSGDRCDLAYRAPCFGKSPCGSFPKAMCFAALGQSGLVDRGRDHLAEPLHREPLAIGSNQNCRVTAARSRKLAIQRFMNLSP